MEREERNIAPAGVEEPEDLEVEKIRLETEVLRLRTQAIEADMRRDRQRLVLDVVKWVVVAAAVLLGYIAADHLGWL